MGPNVRFSSAFSGECGWGITASSAQLCVKFKSAASRTFWKTGPYPIVAPCSRNCVPSKIDAVAADCFLKSFQREAFMKTLVVASSFAMLIGIAHAQGITREELKRADLTGKDMDVIVTIVTVPPGENLPKHIHPGEEVVYVLDGATLELPDGSQRQFPAGAATLNVRNVPHAGFKVSGDKALKMLTVHIVDKGKPVTEVVK
jgi:quercetin dioxygenase-like cupin family protein